MTDPRPTLETPRDADEERRMRGAWDAAIDFLSSTTLSWTMDTFGRSHLERSEFDAERARLIRRRPEYVESEEAAMAGPYRVYRSGLLYTRSCEKWWAPADSIPSGDAKHVAALMAKLEEGHG